MEKSSAIVLVACWSTNDYAALQVQIKECSDVTFVVATVGDFSVSSEEGFTILNWDSDAMLKYLSLHKITSFPCCVVTDQNGIVLQSSTLTSVPSLGEEDYFAQGMEAYNNFDIYMALKCFQLLLAKEPHHLKGLFNMASILHMCGLPILSIPHIETLLTLTPDDITAHSFLWALTADPLCAEVSIACYRRLASSGDLRAITKLATLTGEGSAAARGDPSYARQIYDDMAEKFEGKLVDCLGYKGPWLMLEMLESLTSSSSSHGVSSVVLPSEKGEWRILDVGCGSGLCGRVFTDYVNNRSSASLTSSGLIDAMIQPGPIMVGIDISQRMVDIALEKGGYHYAEAGDLTDTLTSIIEHLKSTSSNNALVKSQLLDMVIAADTFIYIGALGDVFASVYQVLAENGLLMFSIEDLDTSPMRVQLTSDGSGSSESTSSAIVDSENEITGAVPGWGCQLLKSARFAHSHRYIQALCDKHRFRLVAHRSIVLRTEETIPLNGNLYIVQKY